jgi:hypothetical protein
MQGPEAEQAWREFQGQIADEIQYNASASVRQAAWTSHTVEETARRSPLKTPGGLLAFAKKGNQYDVTFHSPAGKNEKVMTGTSQQIADAFNKGKMNSYFKKGSVAGESGDQAAYKAYFEKKLKEWGIKSPTELDDAKKKKFFNEVDDGWTSDDEKKGSPPPGLSYGGCH